jgi:hypothetical protein
VAQPNRNKHLTGNQHNNIVVLMIPTVDPATGYLPPGLHAAPWKEIPPAFGVNSHRAGLVKGLLLALFNLAGAGCQIVLLDGSFISGKPLPQDYDATWEPRGVDPTLLDPVLLDFSRGRAAMKAKYGGEFFPASGVAAPGVLYREFFQKDRSGVAKGILQIDLGSLP